MSRVDFMPAFGKTLDGFDVPPLSDGFTDRVLATASAPMIAPRASRDRRGPWHRGRQLVIGSVAAGLLSAAAVASGLLGAAGIRVPVLTAMLAPKSVAGERHVALATGVSGHHAAVRHVVAMLPSAPSPIADPGPLATGLTQHPLLATRIERAAERRTFAVTHPGLMRGLTASPEARREFMMTHPGIARAIRARRAARREALLEQRIVFGDAALPQAAATSSQGEAATTPPAPSAIDQGARIERLRLQHDLHERGAALRQLRSLERQAPLAPR